jgi:hypothetical protein
MKRKLLILLSLLLLSSQAFAAADIGGYYKNELVSLFKKDGETLVADANKLRLRIDSQVRSNVYFRLEPEYTFLVKSEEFPLLDVSEIDKVILDRAYVKINLPAADITAGKQRIAWGTSYLWAPTDVFNPFALSFAIAEEERRGVDAVRVEVPLGALSEIEGVVLFDVEPNKTAKGLRAKTNVGMYDLSLSYVALGETGSQIGFDTSGELLGLGVRAEAAVINQQGTIEHVKYTLGWNYTFENGVGVDMEYFYNGIGATDKNNYDWTGLASGDIVQLARNYVFFGASYIIDEITDVNAALMVNADDSSFIIYPAYNRNVFENVDLSFEALLPGGTAGGEFNVTTAEDPSGFMGSAMAFLKLKFSF